MWEALAAIGSIASAAVIAVMSGVVAIHRQIAGAHFWENAQYLYVDCKRWLAANEIDYDTSTALGRMAEFTGSATAQPAADTRA